MYFRDAKGTHTARFGEIEQRGIALTAKGRALYDQLLQKSETGTDNDVHQQKLTATFATFPDHLRTLREQQLAWFTYRLSEKGLASPMQIVGQHDIDRLLEEELIIATPMIYEDFLPVSAAGIFQSNLGGESQPRQQGHSSRAAFELDLGAAVWDEIALYGQRQQASLEKCGVKPREPRE